MSRPDREDFWFSIAATYASMATCPRASIGCVIVNPTSKRQVGAGYNGAPSGGAHCVDVGCEMMTGADHCIRAVHAEVNAAGQVVTGVRNLVAYVVGGRDVCSHCARELYAVGVREIKTRPHADRLTEVRVRHLAWVRATFPDETIVAGARHLMDEINELARAPLSGEEYADVRMMLWGIEDDLLRLADANNIDMADEIERKMDVNERRIWVKDGAGTYRHMKEVPSA